MAATVGINSYVTVLELQAYALERGIVIAGNCDILLTRAMDCIELRKYRGSKTDSLQPLEFPRDGETEVPAKIKTAQIVAALLADSGVDFFEVGSQDVKREKVGVLEVEYQDNTGARATYPQLEALLSPFMAPYMRCVRV